MTRSLPVCVPGSDTVESKLVGYTTPRSTLYGQRRRRPLLRLALDAAAGEAVLAIVTGAVLLAAAVAFGTARWWVS